MPVLSSPSRGAAQREATTSKASSRSVWFHTASPLEDSLKGSGCSSPAARAPRASHRRIACAHATPIQRDRAHTACSGSGVSPHRACARRLAGTACACTKSRHRPRAGSRSDAGRGDWHDMPARGSTESSQQRCFPRASRCVILRCG
eukprot:5511772-Pleurochrysis_carterae.AAC.6